MLYKFHSYQDYVVKSIAEGSVYFASRSQFNDPLDCNPPIVAPTYKRFKQVFSRAISSLSCCGQDFKDFATSEKALEIFYRPLADAKGLAHNVRPLVDRVGVLCLTRRFDHPLMWGHYADGHRGFCIGYNIEESYKYLWENVDFLYEKSIFIRPVEYSNEPIDALEIYSVVVSLMLSQSPKKNTDGNLSYKDALGVFENKALMAQFFYYYCIHHLTHKHESWSYEEEVRLLALPNGDDKRNGVRALRPSIIKQVIFGAEMPNTQRDSLRSALKGSDVSFYEAVFSPKELGVDIVPVGTN
ncbi:DUF2971 domain-containing protein [uncultured Marinobacter sp.]|uniref:DUF2971 domain-containing protein n=1 Tax=uncultured Marinobacter sp. TaxID=187379 RepID=UPI0026217756|nr:DUF2971 domain-containing protein [uncultured Marinobacter sp.]